ncbi:hypothetical protein DRE_04667 [Drechslerella stenobrocha 248]|uniref:GH16 domain-containing protein n=1 Tax=Drechslerella stenobrocha 248 TaxID=1043628 RepID=W7I1J6_9PEZI|nr:hypothetical protein DRE_04667 [Drechslerella stenobrocha 248]
MDDSFQTIDPNVWLREQQLDGYEAGAFDWTTSDDSNAYASTNGLVIMPTLTNLTTDITPLQIINGYRLNLTSTGACTSQQVTSCAVHSNLTMGTIINPVRSARLTTRLSKSIKYGRVEVVAKLPKGDWLLPSIKLFPVNETYGEWPRSGSVDIMFSRGNEARYRAGGRNFFISAVHWGVSQVTDRFRWTSAGRPIRRSDYTQEFNTFGLEWTEDYIVAYHNRRTFSVMKTSFVKDSLWDRGRFPNNGSLEANPWARSKNQNAPFDQAFYLSLSVQVGATRRSDGSDKPWVDSSPRPASDFWAAVSDWYPTWGDGEERAMTVRNVKMWQQGKC